MNAKYLFPILLLSVQSIYAQNCDIMVSKFSSSDNEISLGEVSTLKFEIRNETTSVDCQYEPKSVQVVLTFPESGIAFQQVVAPTNGQGEFFEWKYDAEANVLLGLNHRAIRSKDVENITVGIVGTQVNQKQELKTMTINIGQSPDGKIFPSNLANNDISTLQINVRSTKSYALNAFGGELLDCNQIKLAWTSLNQNENDKIELQKSTDGITFNTLFQSKVFSATEITNQSYLDNANLVENLNYYYRIIQIKSNGDLRILKQVDVKNECKPSELYVTLYPNPTTDKVFVQAAGLHLKEEYNLEVSNAEGKVFFKTKMDMATQKKEINVLNFPAGVYHVKLEGMNQSVIKKFIKVE